MLRKDVAGTAFVLAFVLVAVLAEESASERHLQDDETLNLLNGGLLFKRVGSVRLNTRVVSHTFAVPLPFTPADFGWKVDGPCVFGNFVVNCTELPIIQQMQASLAGALDQFQGLVALLPQLDAGVEGARLLKHLLHNSIPDFAPQTPDSPLFPHYLNTTPDPLFGGQALLDRMQDFNHRLGFPTATFQAVAPAITSYLRHLDPAFTWINDLRSLSGKELDDIWAFLEGYQRLLSDQVVSARLGVQLLGELSRAVQGLFAGAPSQLLVPRAAVERAMQDFNTEAQFRGLPFRADPASIANNPLPVSGAVLNTTLYVTVSFYVEPVPRQSFTVYRVVTVPLFLGNSRQFGTIHLIEVPPYLAVAHDGNSYLEMSAEQLAGCSGLDNGICTQSTAVNFANDTESCLWAYYQLDRMGVNERCRFLASMEDPPQAAFQYAKGYVLLTNVGNVIYQSGDQVFTEFKCPGRQCIVKVYCGYSIHTDVGFTIPARPYGCFEENPSDFIRAVITLPVGFKFFTSFLHIGFLHLNLFIPELPYMEVSVDKLRMFDNFLWKGHRNISARLEVRRPPPKQIYVPPNRRYMDAIATSIIASILIVSLVGGFYLFMRNTKKMSRATNNLDSNYFDVDMQEPQVVSFQGLLAEEQQEARGWAGTPSPQSWHRLLSNLLSR